MLTQRIGDWRAGTRIFGRRDSTRKFYASLRELCDKAIRTRVVRIALSGRLGVMERPASRY